MGLDLYMEARIREKKTGRIISADVYDECVGEEEKGFFEICWWCSRDFFDVRRNLIRIGNRYAGTCYTDSDFAIPVPREALRDIYAYLVERACLSDDEDFEAQTCGTEWEERLSYEKMNLTNAGKLHDLLWTLELIEHSNEFGCASGMIKEFIPDINDMAALEEDPQSYEWEFRIYNSY